MKCSLSLDRQPGRYSINEMNYFQLYFCVLDVVIMQVSSIRSIDLVAYNNSRYWSGKNI